MTTKLTLTIEREIINLAKSYANKKGRSLSELIENYLKTLVTKDHSQQELSPTVKRLLGSVKAPKGFDYKKTLSEEINRKYNK
jgi:hypothetical protein